jgi:hypothetical protein
VVQLVLDEHDVLRYSRKDHHHTIAVSDMTQAEIVLRSNLRHPFVAALVVIGLAIFLAYWVTNFGIASLYLFTNRGGIVLTAAFVMFYFLWHLLNMRKIHWLLIQTTKGRRLELPLDGYSHQEANQLIARIHFKLQLQS